MNNKTINKELVLANAVVKKLLISKLISNNEYNVLMDKCNNKFKSKQKAIKHK